MNSFPIDLSEDPGSDLDRSRNFVWLFFRVFRERSSGYFAGTFDDSGLRFELHHHAYATALHDHPHRWRGCYRRKHYHSHHDGHEESDNNENKNLQRYRHADAHEYHHHYIGGHFTKSHCHEYHNKYFHFYIDIDGDSDDYIVHGDYFLRRNPHRDNYDNHYYNTLHPWSCVHLFFIGRERRSE